MLARRKMVLAISQHDKNITRASAMNHFYNVIKQNFMKTTTESTFQRVYAAPEMTVATVQTEKGFATSGAEDAASINDLSYQLYDNWD